MSVKTAYNQFSKGLICDNNEYVTQQNRSLTNALNATFLSTVGEFGAIQNDMGNLKIEYTDKENNKQYVKLPDGFQPIGMKEYNGIIYIASINKEGDCQIGSYPSPDYSKIQKQDIDNIEVSESQCDMIDIYQPLKNCINQDFDGQKPLYFTDTDKGIVLRDCTTNNFNWDVNHPVDIDIQPSYDGSVNLIINDNKNIPRLINSRFSVTSSGIAKIPNRMRNNANLYRIQDKDKFDIDTSLVKRSNKFPVIDYEGQLENGNLKVGNYVFYIKYCDYDRNATDWVAESGIISVFKGTDADPFTINGGIEDENANKTIQLKLTNFDTSYDFIKVYYTRSSSQANIEAVQQAYEIVDPIPVPDNLIITITGNEDIKQIGLDYIQTSYSTIQYAKTFAQQQNYLFFANIKEPDLLYKDLTDVSLHLNPYVKKILAKDKIGHISQKDYTEDSDIEEKPEQHIFKGEYYNTKNIYYNVGYWNDEYYRLGIVYINKDGSLSPVFNLPGGEIKGFAFQDKEQKPIKEDTKYLYNDWFMNKQSPSLFDGNKRELLKTSGDYIINGDKETNINIRGVIHINDKQDEHTNADYIYSLGVKITPEIQNYLFNKGIKGFFIVRKKRIKTILAQGFTMPWDKESHLPVVEYWAKSFPYVDGNQNMANAFGKNTLEHIINPNQSFVISDKFQKYLDGIGGYRSKSNNLMMWFPHYFVESFLTQAGQDVLNGRVGVGSNVTPKPGEAPALGQEYLLEKCLTNSYLPRLHNILPCCIDEKMFDWKRNDKEWVYKQYNVRGYFQLIKNSNVEDDPQFINTQFENFGTAFEQLLKGIGQPGVHPNYFTALVFQIYVGNIQQIDYTTIIKTSDIINYIHDNIPDFDYACSEYSIQKQLEIHFGISSFNYKQAFYATNDDKKTTFSNFNDALRKGIDKENFQSFNIHLNVDIVSDQNAEITDIQNFFTKKDFDTNYTIKEIPEISSEISQPDAGYAASKETSYYYTNQISFESDGSLPIYTKEPGKLDLKNGVYFTDCYYSNYITTNGEGKKLEDNIPYYTSMHFYNRYKYCDGNQLTAICPEFEVNQTDFNQFFTGQELSIKYTSFQQGMPIRDDNNERHYYPYYEYSEDMKENTGKPYKYNAYLNEEFKFKIIGVSEDLPTVGIDNTIFTSLAGNAQEAYRTSFINEQHSAERRNAVHKNYTSCNDHDFNFVRGIYSPYLGIVAKEHKTPITTISEKDRGYSRTFNIYAKGTQFWNGKDKDPNLLIRFNENSPYYPISNRIEFNMDNTEINQDLFRGDCFLCTFTHRVNRNFQDPTAPTNDVILYPETWKKHYRGDGAENDKIQRGDVNAVKLGSWITIKIKSSNNLSIRTIDESNREEVAIFGHGRRFYPIEQISAEGGTKIPTSYVSNNGFRTNLGLKRFTGYKDSSYIRNEFKNRIIYSDVNQTDSFINGYRVFKTGNYQDYSKQYGEITKLIPFANNIICIMEHGVGIIPIKERALVADSAGGEVYINNKTILPEVITMINESYGSQWPESVIATPYYIYGLDASERKIWITDGTKLQIISDNKISKFLQENIPFKENQVNIDIINSNIKTTYNAKKNDVMFTLWDKKSNKIWNICYNITLGIFSTFYSWIPSYSVNVDNTMYSFEYNNNDFWNHDNHIWKHGNDGDNYVKPTDWYGHTLPFEFEFVVNDNIHFQKIFQNLKIIANNAEPESFHFTISGDSYSFKDDLENMYYRQEVTRDLMNSLGSKIEYDKSYKDIDPKQNNKSTVFSEYYKRERPEYYMYEIYKQLTSDGKNYDNLSGTEVVYNKSTQQYEISTHIKNTPIDKKNRIRGNSQYKENNWDAQLPSIIFREKNENKWKKPPIVLPKKSDKYDIETTNIQNLPNNYNRSDLDTEDTWSERKEAKIRDKYIKIKIRYDGSQLATVYMILTMYQLSLA